MDETLEGSTLQSNSDGDVAAPRASMIQVDAAQAVALWDKIRPEIAAHLGEAGATGVLNAIMGGRVQFWVAGYVVEQAGFVEHALLTTTDHYEYFSNKRALLVFSLNAVRPMDAGLYSHIIESLKKYALSHSYSKLVAFSNVDMVVEMARRNGADVSVRFIDFGEKAV